MPPTWDALRLDAIREFVRRWIDPSVLDSNQSKNTLTNYLTTNGFDPSLCFASAANMPPPVMTVRPKFELQKQGCKEEFEDFLRRLENFFAAASVPITDRPALLLANLHQDFNVAANSAFEAGHQTFAELRTELLRRFGKPPLQSYHDFINIRRKADETVKDLGDRLKLALARYRRFPVADILMDPGDNTILSAQLHEGTSGYLQGYIAEQVHEDPAIFFDDLLDRAHAYDLAHRPRSNRPTPRADINGRQGRTGSGFPGNELPGSTIQK